MVSVCLLIYIFPFLIDMTSSVRFTLSSLPHELWCNSSSSHQVSARFSSGLLHFGIVGCALCVFLTFSSTSIFSPEWKKKEKMKEINMFTKWKAKRRKTRRRERHKKNGKEIEKKSEDGDVVSISAYPHFLFYALCHVKIEPLRNHNEKNTIVCPSLASSSLNLSPRWA